MKLQTDIVEKFLNECPNIKPDITATNLDSVKIECTGDKLIFTKTNNKIFLTYTVTCNQSAAETFLVNEGVLRGIITTTTNEFITIESKQNHLLIKDGRDNTKYPIEDIRMFPIAPPPSNEKDISISKQALQRITIASRYIANDLMPTAKNFVNVGSNGIFGSNGGIVYYHDCDDNEQLPEIFFNADALSILKPVDGATYNRHGNYDFFNYDGFSYGFIKSVINTPINFLPLIQQTGECSFILKRDDFINFCKRVKFISKQKYPLCTFKNGIDKLELQHIDSDFDRQVQLQIESQATSYISEFKFSLDQVGILLNSLPYTYLVFTGIGKHYKVTTDEDKNYIGIIAGLN